MGKTEKIYIAGHRGMVGSAIFRKLKKEGHHNIVFRTSAELNLTDQTSVKRFFLEEKPAYVFLAAAKVGGILANNIYRAQFIYENLMIQSNVIHQSYLDGVKKLIFMGSSCIYPKLAPQPIREESLLSGSLEATNEPYALAKIAGLKMCENYYRQYGCNFYSVMPCNLFGPYDNFDLMHSHVLSGLMRKMHLGKCLKNDDWTAIQSDLDTRPIDHVDGKADMSTIINVLANNGITKASDVFIEIWGTGNVLREFLYVDDLADAVYFLFEKYNLEQGNKQMDKVDNFFNIGSGADILINDLAEIIQEIVGFHGVLSHDLNKPDGTPRKLLDVQKLSDLGWQYKTRLKDGISKMYQWYLENMNNG